jgi:lysophospholipase L1-like esterase
MATGFVTTENLGESNRGDLDRGILDNLGGPGITDDILLFDGNSKFISRLVFNQDANVSVSDFLDGVQYRITDLGIASPGGADEIAAAQLVWNTAAGTSGLTYTLYETFTKAPNVVVTGSGKAIGQLANDFTVGDVASEYEITVGTEGKVAFSNGTKLSMSGTLPLGTGEGFVDFGAAVVGQLGVRNKWDGQATLGAGDPTLTGSFASASTAAGFTTTQDNASPPVTNSVKYEAATRYLWGLDAVSRLKQYGYTLQFEIENAIFATDYDPGSQTPTLVYFAATATENSWKLNATTVNGSAKWGISTPSGNEITKTIETANLAPIGSHSLITISVQGSLSPEPYKISIYKDKSLILEAREGDANFPDPGADPGASGSGVLGDLHIGVGDTTHRIKNVMYIDGATIPRRNLRIAVLGDDNISAGQYQADTSEMQQGAPNRQGGMHSYKVGDPLFDAVTPYGAAPHPLHNPPLHGIRQNSRYPVEYLPSTGNRVDDTGAAATEYLFHREESLFARMEYYMANKGLHPTAFAPNQLGIYSAARSGAETDNINSQIDAMLGAALDGTGPGPIGSNLSLDVVVINLGTNDALLEKSADTAKINLQIGIDRIISIFNPKTIVVNTVAMPLLINGSATGIPNTNQQAAAADISDKIVELDGYKDVVAVVNLTAALDTSGRQTGFADAVHYNPKGYKIMAEKIVDKLHFIFATELPESSSFVYDVSDSNGTDKFKVKYDGVPINVTGTLRRNDTVTKTNMEFLNVNRLATSSITETAGNGTDDNEKSRSTFTIFTFNQQKDFIEENLSIFSYKRTRIPFTKVGSEFDDIISVDGNLRIIDTAQTGTVDNKSPGIFMIDPTNPTQGPVRAFTGNTSDWSKANAGTVADAAISNAPVITIGSFRSTTNNAGDTFDIFEITDLGSTTQLHWHAAAGTTSGTDPDYAVGNIFKAAIPGDPSGEGKAKQLGVEKNITGLIEDLKYVISTLGTSQLDWNTAAGTTDVTYVVGSTFTAVAAGAAISTDNGGKAALILASRSAKVTRLKVADPTTLNVVIETFENTQLVEDSDELAGAHFTHKLPVIVNDDTYYILLKD